MTQIVKLNGIIVATSYITVAGKKITFWDFRNRKWVTIPKSVFEKNYTVGGDLDVAKPIKKAGYQGKKQGIEVSLYEQKPKNNKSRKNRRTKKGAHKQFDKQKPSLHGKRTRRNKRKKITAAEQFAASLAD